MIISRTPLRISFFGGGSDFREYFRNNRLGYGRTIGTTIDMYVYITVNKRLDDKLRVVYREYELADSVDEIKHNIIRNALKIAGIESGIEIIYTADIPIAGVGIGLASSSALAVGTLNALYAYKGIHATPEELARDACRLEIDMMGQPIGIQDQFAVSYGGFNVYTFHKDDTVSVEPVVCQRETLQNLKNNLMIFFTGITRDSSVILGEQKENVGNKEDQLDALVKSVDRAYNNLSDGDVDRWGEMLHETWSTKKQLAGKISNPEIDEMYDSAIEAGAMGGKILGAGGGGFLMLYVPIEKQNDVRKALSNYKEVGFDFCESGSQIIFASK